MPFRRFAPDEFCHFAILQIMRAVIFDFVNEALTFGRPESKLGVNQTDAARLPVVKVNAGKDSVKVNREADRVNHWSN